MLFQNQLWLKYEWFPKAGTNETEVCTNETEVWESVVFHPSFCPPTVTAIFHEGWVRKTEVFIIRKVPATQGASSVETLAYCSGQSGRRNME